MNIYKIVPPSMHGMMIPPFPHEVEGDSFGHQDGVMYIYNGADLVAVVPADHLVIVTKLEKQEESTTKTF